MELVEAVNDLFLRGCGVLMQKVVGGGSLVTNEIGERERFIV